LQGSEVKKDKPAALKLSNINFFVSRFSFSHQMLQWISEGEGNSLLPPIIPSFREEGFFLPKSADHCREKS
jgi:hypothetical protein